MSKPIIEVHDLSKQYRLGVIGATALRDSRRYAVMLDTGGLMLDTGCSITSLKG